MHDAVNKAIEFKKKTEEYYMALRGFLKETQDAVLKEMTPEDHADFGGLFREMETFFEEIRKDFTARKDLCGKLICLYVAEKRVADPTSETTNVRGSLFTATPDVTQTPALPNIKSEKGRALAKRFGATDEILDSDTIKFDFRQMVKHVKELTEEGKPLPPEIEKVYPVFKSKYMRRKRR